MAVLESAHVSYVPNTSLDPVWRCIILTDGDGDAVGDDACADGDCGGDGDGGGADGGGGDGDGDNDGAFSVSSARLVCMRRAARHTCGGGCG